MSPNAIRILDVTYLVILFVALVVLTIGFMAILGIHDLDLTRMSNPWGLVAILLGTEGIQIVVNREYANRIRDLEDRVGNCSKSPVDSTETPLESN